MTTKDSAKRTITRIEGQKKNTSRVSVYVDGEFAFGLHQQVLLDSGLYPGVSLSLEEEEAVVEADQYYRGREAALRFLGYRARTEREIRQKLRKIELPGPVIDRTVAYLHEHGYIDDEEFAERYAQQRIEGKGHGPSRIRTDLIRLGVPAPFIDAALNKWANSSRLQERLSDVARKRWKQLRHETDPQKRRKKLLDFLLRRGYSFDDARAVVEELVHSEA